MGETSPLKLDAAAIDRCASIVTIRRSDIFDPELAKLVAGACLWGKEAPHSIATRKARAEIVRTGRVFVATLRKAPLDAKRDLAIFLPYGETSLSIVLDLMGQSLRSARHRARMFVMLLCILVEETRGHLTHNEKENRGILVDLLKALEPYQQWVLTAAHCFETTNPSDTRAKAGVSTRRQAAGWRLNA